MKKIKKIWEDDYYSSSFTMKKFDVYGNVIKERDHSGTKKYEYKNGILSSTINWDRNRKIKTVFQHYDNLVVESCEIILEDNRDEIDINREVIKGTMHKLKPNSMYRDDDWIYEDSDKKVFEKKTLISTKKKYFDSNNVCVKESFESLEDSSNSYETENFYNGNGNLIYAKKKFKNKTLHTRNCIFLFYEDDYSLEITFVFEWIENLDKSIEFKFSDCYKKYFIEGNLLIKINYDIDCSGAEYMEDYRIYDIIEKIQSNYNDFNIVNDAFLDSLIFVTNKSITIYSESNYIDNQVLVDCCILEYKNYYSTNFDDLKSRFCTNVKESYHLENTNYSKLNYIFIKNIYSENQYLYIEDTEIIGCVKIEYYDKKDLRL